MPASHTPTTPAPPAIIGVAIETSGRAGSVAVLRDGNPLTHATFDHGLRHAAGLLPMIARLLADAGLQEPDVAELYVSVGPGSFTGLRIAVTLAKTWAETRRLLGKPTLHIVAVPSVHAIVENLGPDHQHAAVVLDAKRGQIFTATFSRPPLATPPLATHTHATPLHTPWLQTTPARLDTLANVLATAPRPLTLIGEGLDYHPLPNSPTTTPNEPLSDICLADRSLWPARAQATGRLGHTLARAGHFADPLTLTPTYVRLPEAEEKWQADHRVPGELGRSV